MKKTAFRLHGSEFDELGEIPRESSLGLDLYSRSMALSGHRPPLPLDKRAIHFDERAGHCLALSSTVVRLQYIQYWNLQRSGRVRTGGHHIVLLDFGSSLRA